RQEILLRYLIMRKLEASAIGDIHREFEAARESSKNDRMLSYVLVMSNNYDDALRSEVNHTWTNLDSSFGEELLKRRLDYIITKAHDISVNLADGWQANSAKLDREWKLFKLQRP